MSFTESKISDEEMQYYQFKARQMFLLRKEDHEWNQFCKRNVCTCCLCNPSNHQGIKEIGIQTSSTNVKKQFNRNLSNRGFIENKNFPQSLNEIKEKLDKLDLSLSKITTSQERGGSNMQHAPSKLISSKSSASERNVNDERLEIIQNALKGSIQRLQSAATWKGSFSAPSKKKSSGLVLPRDLQEQRIIARRAYLASLEKLKPKSGTTKELSSMTKNFIKKPPTKHVSKKHEPSSSNISKGKLIKKKLCSIPQKRKENTDSEVITEIQSVEMKDENIENAIEVIIDDLIGETALSIHRIKQSNAHKTVKFLEEVHNKIQQTHEERGLVDRKIHHSYHWKKIKDNLSFLKNKMSSNIETEETICTKTGVEKEPKLKEPHHYGTLLQDTVPKPVTNLTTRLNKIQIFIAPSSAKEISKQRKEFQKYLEKISRTKKGSFDPWTLSNLVAESLLNDCMQDVSKELQDVPYNLIMDLYDQEFFSL